MRRKTLTDEELKARKRERARKWREENREHYNAYSRAWTAKNPDRIREIRTRWEGKNPERIREIKQRYYWEHREVILRKQAAARALRKAKRIENQEGRQGA